MFTTSYVVFFSFKDFLCTIENRQHTNTLQPSYRIMSHTRLEVLKKIYLMTYCSTQSIWWVQTICLQYRICSCRILPHFCIDLSVYNFQFIFYHILGIYAVQVSLDAFVLYVAIAFQKRHWGKRLQNFHYWRSWALRFFYCQKNLWKLWGTVVLVWNHWNGIRSGMLPTKSVMRRQLLLQRTCPNYTTSSLLEISWQMMACRPYLMVVLTLNHLT